VTIARPSRPAQVCFEGVAGEFSQHPPLCHARRVISCTRCLAMAPIILRRLPAPWLFHGRSCRQAPGAPTLDKPHEQQLGMRDSRTGEPRLLADTVGVRLGLSWTSSRGD
jgi:hypothetical protein